MRYLIPLFSVVLLSANSSKLCKTCHPTIYAEYQNSMHFKSTIDKDRVHKALWSRHPLSKTNDYKCASCHDPKVENKLDSGVDCVSCHTIKNIKEHVVANINVYDNRAKTFYSKDIKNQDKILKYHKTSSFFGMFSSTVGSPYHDIDYTNKLYYNGKMCMGCHSHLKNQNNISLCSISDKGASSNEQNCITCLMPKVQGSATTIKLTKTHAYHGFLGAYNKPEMLAKYIDLSIKKSANGFKIIIENKTPHPLFTQPLRVVRLNIKITQNGKTALTKSVDFVKVLGKDGKPSLPAFANSTLKDTMLKANEKREINIEFNNTKDAKVLAVLGFFKVNPKSAKMLDLKGADLVDFVELKRANF